MKNRVVLLSVGGFLVLVVSLILWTGAFVPCWCQLEGINLNGIVLNPV